jgi:hypothetical protein
MNEVKEKILLRLPAVLLLAVTLLFWGLYDRYRADGPVLLESPALADAHRVRGDCTEDGDHFILGVSPGEKSAQINFTLPNGTDYDLIRIRGRMRTEAVVNGSYAWRAARMALIQYGADGKWIPGRHIGAFANGTQGWTQYEEIFDIDPQAVRMDFCIQQLGSSGVAEFDQLSAEPVRLRASFRWVWGFFSVAWIAMGVCYYKRCRLHRRRLRLLILLNALAIFLGTLMPGRWIDDTAEYAKEDVAQMVEVVQKRMSPKRPVAAAPTKKTTVAPAPVEKKPPAVLKRDPLFDRLGGVHAVGHYTLFASLCFWVYLSAALERQRRFYFFKVALDLSLFAAMTESLQYLTMDRSPGVMDWAIDLCGITTAFIIFLLLKRWIVPRACPVKKDAF